MNPFLRSKVFFAAIALSLTTVAFAAAPPKSIPLWPADAPGEKGDIGDEKDTSKSGEGLVAGQPLIRLGNVSKPTISIYRPPANKDTGAAVIVCPGGGYHILALDLEGSEVCEWLNSIGVTGVLLKYRVPKRVGLEKHTAALQDAQRAVGLVRHRAKEFGIDPMRLGVLGFSAGGHLAAAVSNNYGERNYPSQDDADKVSCRPDFTVLIYPGYLTVKEQADKVAADLPITTNTPPTFIAMTQDDGVRVENALGYALALLIGLYLVWTFGHTDGLSAENIAKITVVMAFPAALGAAAARLIL